MAPASSSLWGQPHCPMKYLIFASLTNVVLNLLFVPSSAGRGHARSGHTILSQTLSALLAFRKLTHTAHSYRLSGGRITLSRRYASAVVYLGIPSAVQIGDSWPSHCRRQHQRPSARRHRSAWPTAKSRAFCLLPSPAFPCALAPCKQNIGARRYDRVRSASVRAAVQSLLGRGHRVEHLRPLSPVVAAFNSSPEVIATRADARTVSLFYFLLAFSHCCGRHAPGTGRAIIPMAIMWHLVRLRIA